MKTLILSALIAAASLAGTATAQQQPPLPQTTIFHLDVLRDGDNRRGTLGPIGLGGQDRSTREPVSMRQILSAIARHNASAQSSTDRIIIRDTAFGREAFSENPNGLSEDARRAIAIQNATAADASERIYVRN
ncbi:MAG: hypothetical protein AAGE03_03595 [Pseudomonadota bacterium]